MEGRLEENILIVKDSDNNEKRFDILLTLDGKNGKSYIVYSDLKQNDAGDIMVHANIYEPNKSQFKLFPIENDSEWDMIDKVLKSTTEAIMEDM